MKYNEHERSFSVSLGPNLENRIFTDMQFSAKWGHYQPLYSGHWVDPMSTLSAKFALCIVFGTVRTENLIFFQISGKNNHVFIVISADATHGQIFQ